MSGITLDLLAILFTAFVGGLVATYFKQSIITGYILAGLLLGSIFLNTIKGVSNLDILAQIGISLLMFSIGVEFSFERILRVKKTLIYGALIQIFSVIILLTLFLALFHYSFTFALIMGIAFSMSSTALIAKLLTQNEQIDTLEGELTVGWAILQDLTFIPLLILVTALHGESNILISILESLIKAGGILVVVYFLGKEIVPRLFDKLAEFNVHELLFLGVIIFIIGCSVLTQYFGLSYALGAFIAGMILSKGLLKHQLAIDIRPLREVFTVFFFVSVGALLSPNYVLRSIILIIFLTLFVGLVKFLITLFTIRGFGNHSRVAFFTSAYLLHVGEFAFVIASTAKVYGLINENVYSLILSVSLVSIILTPFFTKFEPQFYKFIQNFTKKHLRLFYSYMYVGNSNDDVDAIIKPLLKVVICGYGRTGRKLAHY